MIELLILCLQTVFRDKIDHTVLTNPKLQCSVHPCFQPSNFLTAGDVNEKRELSPVAMMAIH